MKVWLLLFLLSSPLLAVDVEEGDGKPQTVEEELYSLSDLMDGTSAKMWGDRYDQSLQLDQKEISDRIDKLIKEIEEAKESNKPPKGKPLAERWKKLQTLGEGKAPSNNFVRRNTDGHFKEGTGYLEKWNELAAEARAQIIQVYDSDIPVRWKNRIEAYFISVAAETKKE